MANLASSTLALIRIVNGAGALFVPELVVKRLGADAAAIYPLRMFGVRTIVLGVELLALDDEDRRRAARQGIVIHASDTLAAALAGSRGQLPRKVAMTLAAVSALNTGLAIAASRPGRRLSGSG